MIFSLICTYYNRDRYLPIAIQSVLNQTFADWQLILWDDGSTDGSRAIADEFATKDRRIWSGGTAINHGRAMALKNAIQASHGQWFGLIDSDDALTPDALETVLPFTDGDGMIYSDRMLIDESSVVTEYQAAYPPNVIKQTDLYGHVPFHFQLFHRATFDQTIGIDLNLDAAIDYDMALKMLELDAGLSYIAQPLYFHRVHDARISAEVDLQTLEALRATRNAIRRRGLNLQVKLQWLLVMPTPEHHPNAGNLTL